MAINLKAKETNHYFFLTLVAVDLHYLLTIIII